MFAPSGDARITFGACAAGQTGHLGQQCGNWRQHAGHVTWAPNRRPTPAARHCQCTPEHHALRRVPAGAAGLGCHRAGQAQAEQGTGRGHQCDLVDRRQQGEHWQRRTAGERTGRGQRCLQRAGAQGIGDAQFVARMRAQRIVGGELFGYLPGQCRFQATVAVDRGQLFQLAVRVVAQFALLHRQVGCFGVGLGLHRHILAGSHGHRAGYGAGHAGGQNGCSRGAAGRHANHQPGHRDDAIVGAQHGGAQPADAFERCSSGCREWRLMTLSVRGSRGRR